MESQSSTLCNLLLEDSDLKKLDQLDPNQYDGFRSFIKLPLPITITYIDQLANQFTDKQQLNIQILTKWVKGTYKQKDKLQQVRLILTSQDDLYFNFVHNCTNITFQSMKSRNFINLQFHDFPHTLMGIIKNCEKDSRKSINIAEMKLSYQGNGKLYFYQQTQYKKIELLQLLFVGCSVQKIQQSIIYRFNYNNTKLKMLENSILSIYDLLSKKNQPLLQYIQKNVGINQ